jgi:hypothetical protein
VRQPDVEKGESSVLFELSDATSDITFKVGAELEF